MSARAACVIGNPARHSRSPKMHGHWIEGFGLDADYRVEEVDRDAAAALIRDLAGHGYVGANVTMPYKDLAFELSEPDERARAIGAANTLWLDDGVLRSTNTDVVGFTGALDAAAPGWDTRAREAVVLGAGGAGRAVVYGFIERGISTVHVVNRTVANAEALRERFGDAVAPAGLDALPDLLDGARLLANATPLGMHGHPPLDVDLSRMAGDAVVADIVYVPLETPLLAAARERGFATSNGLAMLLHQAVDGFERWFGRRPEVTRELYDLLAADI